jgi:hypothetical protein
MSTPTNHFNAARQVTLIRPAMATNVRGGSSIELAFLGATGFESVTWPCEFETPDALRTDFPRFG